VRNEAFHAQLAYGFLRGRSLEQLIPGCKRKINWDKVKKMIDKHGINVMFYEIGEWNKVKAEQEARFKDWKENKPL
jgi:hypothetical protein